MALVGDLRQVRLVKVLQLLAYGRKSGVLRVKSGRSTLTVNVARGRLQKAWVAGGSQTAESLVELAPVEQRDAVAALAHGSELGSALWLDFLGCANKATLLSAARENGRQVLSSAASWQKGELRFEDGPGLAPGELDLGLYLTPLANQMAKSTQ
jgi:hypothetical protein